MSSCNLRPSGCALRVVDAPTFAASRWMDLGIVRRLQDVSIQEAKTVEGFQWRWQRAQKTIYTGLVKQIDALSPAHLNTPRLPQSPESLLEKVVVTTDI